jgi:selenocysteine lyase/cysteine desulfurase
MRYLADLKRRLRSYDAFQLLVLAAANVMLLVAILTRGRDQLSRAYGNGAVWTAARYCVTYWLNHWRFLFGLTLVLVLLFGFDVTRGFFHRLFRTPLFAPRNRPPHGVLARRLRLILKLAFTGLLLAETPLLHLRLGTWHPIVLYAFLPLPLLAMYACAYGGELRFHRSRPALARHSFPTRSYNVAGVAHPSAEALQELRYYEPLQDRAEYLQRGDRHGNTLWTGNNAFIERLATLLAVDKMDLRLFDATTDAVAHAARECATALAGTGRKWTCLTTDAEYGSVRDTLTSLVSDAGGVLRIVPVRAAIYGGRSPEQIAALLLAELATPPDMLCISHVCHETGFIMPIVGLLPKLEKCTPRPYIIVDGAQAAGHVAIPPALLNNTHYYATSGHKWLLGHETLGILFRNSAATNPRLPLELPSTISLDRWAPVDVLEQEVRKTIPAAPRVTLNASLTDITPNQIEAIAKHNAARSRRFRQHIEACPAFKVVPIRTDSGICLVEVDGALIIAHRLRRAGYIVGLNNTLPATTRKRDHRAAPLATATTPTTRDEVHAVLSETRDVLRDVRDVLDVSGARDRGTLRICFHYYHSEDDVDSLLYAMQEQAEDLFGA